MNCTLDLLFDLFIYFILFFATAHFFQQMCRERTPLSGQSPCRRVSSADIPPAAKVGSTNTLLLDLICTLLQCFSFLFLTFNFYSLRLHKHVFKLEKHARYFCI